MDPENWPEKGDICIGCPKQKIWEATFDVLEEISREAQTAGRSALTMDFRCRRQGTSPTGCDARFKVSGADEEDSQRITGVLIATIDPPRE